MARTTTGELILFCNECEFPADDLYDLGQHMYEYHSEDEGNGKIACHFCDETFETKDSIMKHRKQAHKEKVKQCIYFSAGNCNFDNDSCWFDHSKTGKSLLNDDSEIKCKHCGKRFQLRSEFMQHRKKHHTEFVPMCTNFQSGNCEYSLCWFKHNENEESTKDQDISENIVDMMEKLKVVKN